MRKPLLVAVISIIYLQCLESRKQRQNDRKTVDEVYSKHCLPKRTDRLVYRYQNDSHVFVGFDNLEHRKVTTLFWKIKEAGHGGKSEVDIYPVFFFLSFATINVSLTYEPRHENTCFCHMRTTKAQISTFVIRCLDSIISLVSISEISSLYLVSGAEQAGLSLT